MKKTQILKKTDIHQKLKRIAYQILENNTDDDLVLVGINFRGARIAEHLKSQLEALENREVRLLNVKINPAHPVDGTQVEGLGDWINEKIVIIVDDVANTGRTSLYAMGPFLDYLPKKIEIAVLVDREHKRFPVFSDYVGLSLSTTLQEHIEVELENDEISGVFLE